MCGVAQRHSSPAAPGMAPGDPPPTWSEVPPPPRSPAGRPPYCPGRTPSSIWPRRRAGAGGQQRERPLGLLLLRPPLRPPGRLHSSGRRRSKTGMPYRRLDRRAVMWVVWSSPQVGDWQQSTVRHCSFFVVRKHSICAATMISIVHGEPAAILRRDINSVLLKRQAKPPPGLDLALRVLPEWSRTVRGAARRPRANERFSADSKTASPKLAGHRVARRPGGGGGGAARAAARLGPARAATQLDCGHRSRVL